MICFGVVAVILLVGWPLRRTVLTLLVGGAGFLVIWLDFPTLVTALTTLFSSASSDTSILARTRDYDAAFAEAAQHVWLGRGLGTWLSTKYNILDNQYLHSLLETGVVGVVAFVLLFLVPVVAVIRMRARLTCRDDREFALTLVAALSVDLIGSITYDSLSYPIATGLAFVLIGAAGAALRICHEQLDQPLEAEVLDEADLPAVPHLPALTSDQFSPPEGEEIYDAEIVEVTPISSLD
jgi:O-antigen ligase